MATRFKVSKEYGNSKWLASCKYTTLTFFPDHVGNNRMGDAVDDELPVKSLVVTGIALA